jgi:hypothetical protein
MKQKTLKELLGREKLEQETLVDPTDDPLRNRTEERGEGMKEKRGRRPRAIPELPR